ncbi:MAG: hypothetical protein JXJ19_00250 [Elusimicrobia bacterium]|nr:hypothetical protein [Elusimicrobiota bacterium]
MAMLNIPKKDDFKSIYTLDEETGAYIIEIALDKYSDIFNEWDPAPFKKRLLDPDLFDFIDEKAEEIPLKYKVLFYFHIPKEVQSQDSENTIIEGISTYYNTLHDAEQKEIMRTNKRIIRYIITAFSLLFLAIGTQTVAPLNIFLNVLQEGLFIGGWVFLWEAFNVFFFAGKHRMRRAREYTRYAQAPIWFKYDG